MSRKLFNVTEASSSVVLSSATRDWGLNNWKGGSGGAGWVDIFGTNQWVTLKVMRSNPSFDIEFNLGCDHQTNWNSQVYMVSWAHSTDNKLTWSADRNTKIYCSVHSFNNSNSDCGTSKGACGLFQPTGVNAGTHVRFGIKIYWDDSSNVNYINQNSENLNGTSSQSNEWRGMGAYLRVREINDTKITLRGITNSNSGSF
jgi:hypothetical protein